MLHKNFSLKFRKLDIIILILCIVLSCGLMTGILLKNKALSKNDRYVYIYQNNVLITEYVVNLSSLKEDKIIILEKEKYPTLVNDYTIEINPSKGVRVKDIDCSDHTCENQGWINMTGLPIVCIPNSVYIEIKTGNSSDGDFVIGGVYYEQQLS